MVDPDQILAVAGLTYKVGDRVLLDSVSLQLSRGESIAIVGPSGAGKTTLLSCVLGLVQPSAGTIEVAGRDVCRLGRRALTRHRRDHIGMVFQFGELLAELTPVENVALAALLGRGDRSTAYDRATALLDMLGVPAATRTDRLSGGERQRTAVARALINGPELIVADEPTGSLDRGTSDQVADLLFGLPTAQRCAVLVVTHDSAVARRADRVLELIDGRLAETAGTP
jgi:ABC-type lipoprotein export system ATPase subunit